LVTANLTAQDYPLHIEVVQDTFVVQYEERPTQVDVPVDSTGRTVKLAASLQVPVNRIPVTMFRPFFWVKGQKVYVDRLAWSEPVPQKQGEDED